MNRQSKGHPISENTIRKMEQASKILQEREVTPKELMMAIGLDWRQFINFIDSFTFSYLVYEFEKDGQLYYGIRKDDDGNAKRTA